MTLPSPRSPADDSRACTRPSRRLLNQSCAYLPCFVCAVSTPSRAVHGGTVFDVAHGSLMLDMLTEPEAVSGVKSVVSTYSTVKAWADHFTSWYLLSMTHVN